MKQARSFTTILHIDTSTSSKPPSSNKSGHLQGQYTRTIDQTLSSKINSHHSISHHSTSQKQNGANQSAAASQQESSSGLTHHQSLSHVRTQATLGLKQPNSSTASSNLIRGSSASNSRHHESTHQQQAHAEKHGKQQFTKNRFSQQIISSSGISSNQTVSHVPSTTSSTTQKIPNRLLAHKTSLNDFKKPVSLTSNPISSTKLTTTQTASGTSMTPTSQVVSAHSYQPSSQQQQTSSTTWQQTPSSSMLLQLRQKPPISGHSINEAASTSKQHTHSHSTSKVGSSSTGGQKRQSSPQNQLLVFTKKQSLDVTGKHPNTSTTAINGKQSFSHTTSSVPVTAALVGSTAFSPSEEDLAKRRELVKTHTQHPQSFKSSSMVVQQQQNSHSSQTPSAVSSSTSQHLHHQHHQHPQHPQHPQHHQHQQHQQRTTTSGSTTLKNQVSQLAKNERNKNLTHQQTSGSNSSQSTLKSRNLLSKGAMGGSHAQLHNNEQRSKLVGPAEQTPHSSSTQHQQVQQQQQQQQQQLQQMHHQHRNQQAQSSNRAAAALDLERTQTSKSAQKEIASSSSQALRHIKKHTLQQANQHSSNLHQQNYPQTTKHSSSGAHRSSSVSMNTHNMQNIHTNHHHNNTAVGASSSKDNNRSSAAQQAAPTTATGNHNNNTLDRFKDKHPKLHQQANDNKVSNSKSGNNTGSSGTPTILSTNAYRGHSAKDKQDTSTAPLGSDMSKAGTSITNVVSNNASGMLTSQRYPTPQQSQTTVVQQNSNSSNSFVTQLSHKMAQNRVPQISAANSKQQEQKKSTNNQEHNRRFEAIQQPSQEPIGHQQKMTTSQSNQNNTAMFQRKVRSATRASELTQQNDKDGHSKQHYHRQTATGSKNTFALGKYAQNQQHQLSQKKITDRPQSASAGQKFIGRQQNLKELFERNWQSVNVQNKVDPQSGEATQIRSLTVVDTNCMVHEDQQEAAALPLAPGTRIIIPNHEPTKCSNKRNGIVRAYAANTNQGLVRNYNEDRVSIILNIVKPEHRKHETWPTCSFFGVYDGHGGSACAEYLRDNLHHYVIKEESFPWQPEEAIRQGFEKAESRFLEMCQAKDESTGQMTVIERSGSCAIVVLIVGEICYTANVGDSRAVLSSNAGHQMTALSRDHKPSDIEEYQRIIKAGGQIYQTTTSQTLNQQQIQTQQQKTDPEFIVGPIRVLPGRLSVCRTFGDPEAKLEYRGGNPNVVKAVPDIRKFQISKQHDFIVLASDGIYDKLTDDDIGKAVWLTCEAAKQAKSTQSAGQQVNNMQQKQQIEQNISVHQYCGLGVEGILKNSLMRQSLDNVTVVMVAFANFKRIACGHTRTDSTDKFPENHQAHQTVNESAQKAQESAQNPQSISNNNEPTPSKSSSSGLEKENSNFMSNTKKTAIARSHQQLTMPLPQSSQVSQTGDESDVVPSTSVQQHQQERHLKRQSDHIQNTGSRQNLQPSSSGAPRLEGHQHQQLQRTRSQQHDGYSISRQQQQQHHHQQSSAATTTSGNVFQKPKQSMDHRAGGAGSNVEGRHQQMSKPPMSSQATSQQQQASLHHQHGLKPSSSSKTGHLQHKASSGMRSLSVKEASHQLQNQINNAQQQQFMLGGNGGNFHTRLNQLANLNSNKSLGTANGSHAAAGSTPSTSSSLKSSQNHQHQQRQHPHQQHSQSAQQQQLMMQQQTQQSQQSRHSRKPSPSQINHHLHY